MKRLSVEYDIHKYLVAEARSDPVAAEIMERLEARRRGETVSDVLRRQIASLREARPDGTRTHKRKKAELRSRKLSLCLKKVSTNAAAVSNFRRILSCLHALNPK